MTGGYLKQLQLTKQLEEQAKKAAKNRESAEAKIAESEELIASAKKIGANAAKAEKLLVEANESYSRKDYKGALSQAVQSIELALEAKAQKIKDILNSTQELLDGMGKLGEEAKEPRAAIGKARELIESGQIEDAYSGANAAWDVTERYINAKIADEFERAQSLLLLAQDESLNTDSEREQLSQARRSLESEDFMASLDLLNSCLDSLTESLTNLFQRRRQDLESGFEKVEDIEIDVSKVREQIERANGHLTQVDMQNAFSELTIADGEFRKSFSRTLLQEFGKLESRAQFLSGHGEDVSPIDSSIDNGRKLTRDGKHWEAHGIFREAEREVSEKELGALIRIMYSLKPKLQIARRTGNDTSEALSLLKQAKKVMREGDFASAAGLVQQADDVLEKELTGFREVERELKVTEDLMSLARGYELDRSKAEKSMKASRGFALKGLLGESMEQLRAAQKELNKEIQQHLGSEIMRTELLLASAIRMGADVSKESAIIDDIMARIRNGDYSDVDDPLNRCKMSVLEFLEISAKEAITLASGLIERYQGMADVTSPKFMLDKARAAFDSKEFDKAFKLAGKAVEELESRETAVLEGGLNEARRLLEINKALGEESVTINKKFSKADALRLDGDTKEAITAVNEVLQLAGLVVKEQIAKDLNSISRSLSAAKKKGVVVTKIERLVQRVSKYLEQGNVADAYDTLHEADEGLRATITRYEEVSEYLEETGGFLEEAASNDIDIAGPDKLLEETEALFESGEYERAVELAKKTREDAEAKIGPFMSARILQDVRNLTATAKRLNMDVSKEEAAMRRGQSLLNSKDYNKALVMSKETRDDVRTRIIQTLEAEITNAREMMARADDLGVDFSAMGSIVDRAENLLSEGRINDTLRAIELVKKELDQGLVIERKAQEGIDRASAIISNVRKADFDPGGAADILKQAKEQAQAGRHGIALELAKKSADHAAEAARSKLMERFKNLEMTQRAMDIDGSDLAQASRMKTDFRKMIEEWKFTGAVTALNSLEEELKRVEKQKKLASQTIEETGTRVERARDRGLVSQKVDELLRNTNERMEEGAYSNAFSEAIKCREELRSLEDLYERRRGDQERLREKMRHAADMGIDVSIAEEYFDSAQRLLKELEFEEASLNLSRGDTALNKRIEEILNLRGGELNTLNELSKEIGLEGELTERVSALLAKKHLELEDFEQLNDTIRLQEDSIRSRLQSMVGDIMGKIQVASKSGADVSTSEYLLSQVRELIRTGDLREAFTAVKEAEGSIGVALEERREFMELKMRCESLIENARRNGLVMESVFELFKRAEEERQTDYMSAIETMKEALLKAEEEAASYLPELAIDIDFIDKPVSGKWMRTRLVVTNETKAMARDVQIELEGDIEVRGLEGIKKIRGNEEMETEVEIMPLHPGKIEVRFNLSCRPVLSEDSFGFDSSFELDVE